MEGTPSDKDLSESSSNTLHLLQQTGIKFNVFNLNNDSNLKQHLISSVNTQLPLFYADKIFIGNHTTLNELAGKEELL